MSLAISQNTGILPFINANTGKVLIGAERFKGLGGIYASPISARDA